LPTPKTASFLSESLEDIFDGVTAKRLTHCSRRWLWRQQRNGCGPPASLANGLLPAVRILHSGDEYSLTRIFLLGHIIATMIETLKALAEPNRLHIVELLRDGPRPVGDMVDRLHLHQPQVSKHLRVLSNAGLVDSRVDAQRRIYALRPAPLQQLDVWLEKYRQLWEQNFQRLDALLDEMKTTHKKPKRPKR
jgi:DNA-binding transcriptional ArsR family regulator